jgi:hypothetical protein
MSAIICSGDCGLIGPSKVGGGASDIFEIFVGFCVFPSIFSNITFWQKRTLGAKTGPKSQVCLDERVFQLYQTTIPFLEEEEVLLRTNCVSRADRQRKGGRGHACVARAALCQVIRGHRCRSEAQSWSDQNDRHVCATSRDPRKLVGRFTLADKFYSF